MEQDFHKELYRLALPAWVSLVLKPTVEIIEHSLVSWRLGTQSLAALGAAGVVLDPIVGLATAPLCWHTTALVARSQRSSQESASAVNEALMVALVTGTICGILLWRNAQYAVEYMGAEQFLITASSYLRIRSYAVPLIFLSAAAQGAFRGLKDTRTPLVLTTLQQVVRLAIGFPILHWWFSGRVGLQGHAWVSVAGEACTAVLYLMLIIRKVGFKLSVMRVRGAASFFLAGGFLLVRKVALEWARTGQGAMATKLGEEQAAAHALVRQITGLVALNIDCLEVAAQVMVAARMGSLKARAIGLRLVTYGAVFGALLGTAVVLGRWHILHLLTQDGGVRDAAANILPLVGILQLLAAPAFVLDGIFVGSQHYAVLAFVTSLAAAASHATLWVGAQSLLTVWVAFGGVVFVRALCLGLHLFCVPGWRKVNDRQGKEE
eukprot:gnl/MRDRNA2_/MRDRNA2_158681_c0_seq1.p1 gnl/MRDRNA2_/MRDRNA2_158681_c0~~gnl/MRDRNA2_/MRDRNA2_158681_c0_seq1.p1  ORF type:complete len:435 (-),score=61.55 gnl/MRDRNA2_/MRDRNA2_158681_c0_seq1:69-1373(-)